MTTALPTRLTAAQVDRIFAKPRTVNGLRVFLKSRGCDLLPATNDYELIRFRAGDTVNIVYRDKRGRKSLVGEQVEQALKAFHDSSRAGVGTDWRAAKAVRHLSSFQKKGLKGALWLRDGDECWYCGEPMTPDEATLEHFVSLADRGPNNPANAALAHKPCNQRAGDMSVVEKVRLRDTIRAEKAASRAAEADRAEPTPIRLPAAWPLCEAAAVPGASPAADVLVVDAAACLPSEETGAPPCP